jgi:hypothetical protein
MEKRGRSRSRQPVLKHGPNTSCGGNARKRACHPKPTRATEPRAGGQSNQRRLGQTLLRKSAWLSANGTTSSAWECKMTVVGASTTLVRRHREESTFEKRRAAMARRRAT